MTERASISTLRDPAALALATRRLDGLVVESYRALTGHSALQMRPPRARRRLSDAAKIRYWLEHGQWRTHRAVQV